MFRAVIDTDVFVAGLCSRSGACRWRPIARDADDDLVIETAVNGGADAIATFNGRDMGAAARFGVEVLLPSQVLRRIE